MPGANLLALIDDIATILDDVAILSKVAAKKTAGVLGDDLALNAEQVSGVKAERELPVVWAVAKDSFLNKLILVPSALLISAFLPWLIVVLLVIGGLYLCFEGVEKLAHKFLHSKDELQKEHAQKLAAVADPNIDLVALEKKKIKGAIRTDFILSAEIVVIVLGTVQAEPFATQVTVVSLLALAITVSVYGLVAGIVKLDDVGLYLLRKSVSGSFNSMQRAIGRGLLITAPLLMKTLSVVGTAAIFLVGGRILVTEVVK
jgi:predicted DNA repair protein MutK